VAQSRKDLSKTVPGYDFAQKHLTQRVCEKPGCGQRIPANEIFVVMEYPKKRHFYHKKCFQA